ncbi:MAG: hypothetical protein HOP23_17415 [Methylococcaceae bacterium]|nr:hypothetical protein [Methylococcaceae bacterium]
MKRSNLHAIGVHLGMAALIFLSSMAEAASFNYLYIEASEGNSSGGHTAIQFDDEIYHYQHLDSGLIRLFRREKTEFHFLYRYLQNRPMHLSRVDVTDETFDLLKDQFKWQFLTQERQFKLLDDLHKDQAFLRRLLQRLTTGHVITDSNAASVMRLKGVGLFYPEPGHQAQYPQSDLARQQSLSIQNLRRKVELRFGEDFLHRRRQNIESQLKMLVPGHWPAINSDSTGEKFPSSIYSFSDRYSDYLTALFAIKTLVEAPPLISDAFFRMKQEAFRISDAERRVLRVVRTELETSLVNAIDSNRPDWGYAVLVNMARFIAVDASLQSGFWAFVDDFAEDSERLRPDQYLNHGEHFQVLISDARADLDRNLQLAVARQRLTETEYSQTEMAANRYVELSKNEQHRDIRYNGEKTLPSKSIGFPDGPIPELSPEQITIALSALTDVENSLIQKLQQDFRYDLISRNCVTELFRTINQALLKSFGSIDESSSPDALVIKESEKRLGGYVDSHRSFIPFVSYQAVLNNYHVTHSRDLDSYRGLELAKLKSRQNSVITTLRESNILSSHLYKYNPEDAFFVFFTGDNLLLRPVFGLFNTVAGIVQSVYGFFTWPLDSGKNLQLGATGILMSLPELVFFNMRKGSYKFLSFNELANAELLEDR